MSADALIDFDRRLHAEYLGNRKFALWLTGADLACTRVQFSGPMLKQLLDDRHTIVSEPLKLARDGREVIIILEGEEIGKLESESVRDLVRRSVTLRINSKVPQNI